MQNIHDDLNESMELERQKIATRYLRVCIEPLWGVETPWYIFYASLLVLTDWVTRNSIMENVRQAMAVGLDWSKLKSKFKSMYSMRILLLCRVPIEVEEFSTWSISKLSQLLPCFRWGRCGDFASEQKFLVVINILGGWHFQLIFVREGGCPYFFVCFFLLLFSNPFRNPSCSKIDQSPIIFSFAFLPQDEKKNTCFSTKTKHFLCNVKVKQVLKIGMIALSKHKNYQWLWWLLFVSVASVVIALIAQRKCNKFWWLQWLPYASATSFDDCNDCFRQERKYTKLTELVLSSTETLKIFNTCGASVWELLTSIPYLSYFAPTLVKMTF